MNKKIGAWLAAIATAVLVLVSVAPQASLAVYEEAPLQIQPRLAPVEAPAGNDGGPESPGGGGSGSGQDSLGPSQLGPGNVGPGEAGPGEPPGPDKSRPSWSDWWKDRVDRFKQGAQEFGQDIVDGAKSAWDTVSTAAVNAWDGVSNWAVGTWNGFSPQVRGALKGLVGGLIALAVIALVVLAVGVVALGGWVIIAIAAGVAVVTSVAYGWMAGDKASIAVAAVVGTISGLTTLFGGRLWWAGFQKMTWGQLLANGLKGGVLSAVITAVFDTFEVLVLHTKDELSLTDIGIAFVKGFIAGILLAPIAKAWPRYVRRAVEKRGSTYWRIRMWAAQLVTAAGYAATAKALVDTFNYQGMPDAVTIPQILGVGLLVGLLSFLNIRQLERAESVKEAAEEAISEAAERVTDTTIKLVEEHVTQPSQQPTNNDSPAEPQELESSERCPIPTP